MVKKHLIACSGLFLLTATGTALILSNTTSWVENHGRHQVIPGDFHEKTPEYPSFANELMPQGDSKITYRLNKQLRAHEFEQLQTSELHNKAEKWFPIIEPILADYGIPDDFKYITLVESGLKEGTSTRGASGYWQFMPGTARSYGLKVTNKADERLNMRKSTIAACKYIRELYAELNSWTLAAAAYNVGDTKLKYQMSAQNQRNYYKMKLNRETAVYVYKLISMKQIIENPADYGYKNKPKLLAKTGDGTLYTRSFSHINAIRPTEVWQN